MSLVLYLVTHCKYDTTCHAEALEQTCSRIGERSLIRQTRRTATISLLNFNSHVRLSSYSCSCFFPLSLSIRWDDINFLLNLALNYMCRIEEAGGLHLVLFSTLSLRNTKNSFAKFRMVKACKFCCVQKWQFIRTSRSGVRAPEREIIMFIRAYFFAQKFIYLKSAFESNWLSRKRI